MERKMEAGTQRVQQGCDEVDEATMFGVIPPKSTDEPQLPLVVFLTSTATAQRFVKEVVQHSWVPWYIRTKVFHLPEDDLPDFTRESAAVLIDVVEGNPGEDVPIRVEVYSAATRRGMRFFMANTTDEPRQVLDLALTFVKMANKNKT